MIGWGHASSSANPLRRYTPRSVASQSPALSSRGCPVKFVTLSTYTVPAWAFKLSMYFLYIDLNPRNP